MITEVLQSQEAGNPQDACKLLRACIETGSQETWQEFVRCFDKLIAGIVMRTARRWGGCSPDLADDLVQEAYVKLCADGCRVLRDFQNQHAHSIYGYLKTVAANVVNDYFRYAHAEKRGGGAGREIEDLPEMCDSAAHLILERRILLDEVDFCLQRCTPGRDGQRDRLIFRLYYSQGLSARAIAALPSIGLSIKGVESAILRITRLVRNQLNGANACQIKQGDPESTEVRPTFCSETPAT